MLALALGFASCDRTPKGSASLKDVDLVVYDQGHLKLYQSTTNTLTDFKAETDSVINAVFGPDNKLYYTVAKSNNLTLKCIDLNEEKPEPKICAGWNLKLGHCQEYYSGDVSELFLIDQGRKVAILCGEDEEENYGFLHAATYDIASGKLGMLSDDEFFDTEFYVNKIDDKGPYEMLMVYYNFVWDYFGFKDAKLYHIYSHQVTDYHWVEDNDIWEDKMYYDDYSPYAFSSESEQFYYDNFGEHVCLSDQLDPKALVSDPDYAIGLEYYEGSVSPKGDMVLFMAPIEAGDFEHGPYCVASLDGKFQTMFPETDFCQNEAVWLSDGSLVFQSADENTGCIKILYPDHKTDILSYATMFVKRE